MHKLHGLLSENPLFTSDREGLLSERVLPVSVIPGNPVSDKRGSRKPRASSSLLSLHSAFALIRRLHHRWRRRSATPELPVEDHQPDRHDAQHDAIEQVGLRKVRTGGPEPSYRDGPLGGVGHERHEHAAARAVEQPRVPERYRKRSQKVAHDDRRLQAALFQEEDGHMPAGYKHAEDEGGHHWRDRILAAPGGRSLANPAPRLAPHLQG